MAFVRGKFVGFQNIRRIACIHGRFQPFHLGHAEYLQACLRGWDDVVVGIAAATPVSDVYPGVEHRVLPTANPLNYLERIILVRRCCDDLGIDSARIEFAPFPIDTPSLIQHSIPKEVTCVTTRLYDWNDEKIRRLRNEGYDVSVIPDSRHMGFDGRTIRRLIKQGDDRWKDMVSPSVAECIERWGLRERILKLEAEQHAQGIEGLD
ncbi:MAG: hypothetical protein E6Q88_01775 [Lysobacteraceae bacterium]|nr:MAG: hypothetical protein E6Q88_01775 [Xanthomonadaceae bacterium]